MALPQGFTASRMSNATFGDLIDDRVGDLERTICDINGIPFETPINAPGFLWDAAGLKKVLFQDNLADPAALGELTRRGPYLKFHDGASVRVNQALETFVQGQIGVISNTAIETAYYNPSIPANALGTRNRIVATMLCRVWLRAGANLTFLIYWAGQNFVNPVISNASGIDRAAVPVMVQFGVTANGTTGAQIVFADLRVLSIQTNVNPFGVVAPNLGGVAGATKDSTVAQSMQLNVLFSAADSQNAIDQLGGSLVVLG